MKPPIQRERHMQYPVQPRHVSMGSRPLTPPNMPGSNSMNEQRGVTVPARNRQFLTAVCRGDANTVDKMLSPSLLKIHHPGTKCTPLMMAVIFNHVKIVELITNIRNAELNQRDAEGRTALHYAAAASGLDGDTAMFFMLTEAGARDNMADREGFTALDVRQNPSVINITEARMLNTYPIPLRNSMDNIIDSGTEAELVERIRHADLDISMEPPATVEKEIYQRLIVLQAHCLGIWDAVAAEDDRTLKQLLYGKDMGMITDKSGKTPLHYAYKRGSRDLIEFLLYLCPESAAIVDKKGRIPASYAISVKSSSLGVPQADNRRGSRTKILHQSRFQSIDTMRDRTSESTRSEDAMSEVLERLLQMKIIPNDYTVLEELQIEGKADLIWKTLKKNVANERLAQHINEFRQLQTRLNDCIDALEQNEDHRLHNIVDEQVLRTRDTRGMRLLHIAVLRERHEVVEFLITEFPACINLVDQYGRSAAHYAAVQPNAIFDTLREYGADMKLLDQDGNSPETYRTIPDRLIRPTSAESSSLMLRSTSTDDEFFDPDAPSEEQVVEWVELGDVARVEQLVLDGRGHMLRDKTTHNTASKEFLKSLAQYQSKIDAIHKAVEEGDVRRVKSLIDRPQLSTARDTYGMTPLHKALLHGQTNTVRYLLAKYPSCVNATDHAGRTPLHYAAADPNGEHMIKVLQKSGGDAFIEDKHGHTPFYYRTHGQRLNVRSMKDNAVMNHLISGQLSRPLLQDLEEDIYDWIHTGNIGKLEELVLTGYADMLLGRTHEVEDVDSIGFLEVLPQYQAKIQAIHKAVETGNLRAVKLLTDRKKLALCRDNRGLSPLHKAIVFDRTDIAKYLIRNYPQSINAMDQKKRTPLHYAAAMRDGGYLYKVMRKAGADPNIYDCNGRAAKHYLKHTGEIDLTAMRLDTKAALKQVLHNRVAPSYLESSIQQWLRDGQIAKLEQLVLSGCGDLLQSRTATNPETCAFLDALPEYIEKIEGIHRAIKEGDLDKVRTLMVSKKLAICRDRMGCTPLHAAIVHEKTDIVRYIASAFTSVLNAPDYNKRTSMHYAAAARDGGHYLKILGKAGADPMAVDNEGRTPDYYRRNTVFDLKVLKDRDQDFNEFAEGLLEDGPMLESPASPETASETSNIDSARLIDDDDDFDRARFEKMVHGKVELPTSENGIYLARTVAPVLTKALAEVLLRRPADPIGFISDWLQKYHTDLPRRSNGKHRDVA